MPDCFHRSILLAFTGVALAGSTAPVYAASLAGQSLHKSTSIKTSSVVRVDARTGHLVRSVMVAPKPIAQKIVAPVAVEKIADNSEQAVLTSVLDDSKTAAAVKPDLQQLIESTAKQFDMDPLLVHSVIQVESNYNQYAVSPKGAQGLMQLIPSTARRFGARNSFDARENLEAGVRYLKYLNTLYPNDLRLTLAAYNAGEAAVAKYGNNVPPYRETENYVYNVGKRYGKARAAQKVAAAPAAPQPQLAPEEKHPPVEAFLDSEGRLHLRTKSPEVTSTP
jgi:soluble lytic murein transglycosylase-like protein